MNTLRVSFYFFIKKKVAKKIETTQGENLWHNAISYKYYVPQYAKLENFAWIGVWEIQENTISEFKDKKCNVTFKFESECKNNYKLKGTVTDPKGNELAFFTKIEDISSLAELKGEISFKAERKYYKFTIRLYEDKKTLECMYEDYNNQLTGLFRCVKN